MEFLASNITYLRENTVVTGTNRRGEPRPKVMTQEDLGKAVGKTQGMIANIENKRMNGSVETLNAIASVFGVTLHELMNVDLTAREVEPQAEPEPEAA